MQRRQKMRRLLALSFVLFLVYSLVAGGATAQAFGGRTLTTTLSGANEVPGPGEAGATGTARLTLNPGHKSVCFTISANVPYTAAHIHAAPVGVAGPIVVPLTSSGQTTGCVSASRHLIVNIISNPSAYYVNIHNAAFPAGAARGQL
jgi:hypothetical protein